MVRVVWLCRRAGARLLAISSVAVVFASLFAIVGVGVAHAHTPHDVIRDVAPSPDYDGDGTIYTISREYLLKSTDAGETWARLVRGLDNKGNLLAVEVSPTEPNVVYAAASGDGIYKSTDAGASWSKVNQGLGFTLGVHYLAVSPHTPDVVLAIAGEGRLFTTTNGGQQWTEVPGLPSVVALAFAPDAPGVVFAGDATGAVHVSDDSGTTWSAATVGDGVGVVNAIAPSPSYATDRTFFVATATGGIFETTDGGESFSARNDGLSDRRAISVALSPGYPADGTVWASTWSEGVFTSTDGGSRWSRTSDGLTTNEQADLLGDPQFGALVVSSASGADPTVFLAGFDGLFRSDNRGRDWVEVETQASNNIQAIAVSPDYAKDSTIAIATYINGAHISKDRGGSWKPINTGLATRFEWIRAQDWFARLTGILFSPTYAEDRTLFSGLRGYMLRSTNDGAEWTATIPPGLVVEGEFPPDYLLWSFSPDFGNDRTIVLGTDSGKVFRSTDGGATLTKVTDIGVEITSLVGSGAYGSGDATLFAGTPDGVYTSTDVGDTWSLTGALPAPVTSLAISPNYAVDGQVIVGTRAGVFVTTNRGSDWQRLDARPLAFGYVESIAISPNFEVDGEVLVSLRGLGLFKSDDAGESFRPTGTELLDDNYVLASFYHPTSEPIVYSPNYAIDHTVYGFAQTNLFRSEDGGDTWTAVSYPVATHTTDEDAAPRPLLLIPRSDRADGTGSEEGAVTRPEGNTGLAARLDDITPGEILVSAIAGIVALAASFFVTSSVANARRRYVTVAASTGATFAVVLVALQLLR